MLHSVHRLLEIQQDSRRLQRVGLPRFIHIPQAVWLKVHDRLCGSLTPSIRSSFPILFKTGTPVVDLRRYSGYPELVVGYPSRLTPHPLTFSCLDFPPHSAPHFVSSFAGQAHFIKKSVTPCRSYLRSKERRGARIRIPMYSYSIA